MGVAVQGQFATSKALLDMLVALGSFGFPQSVILVINRDGVSRSRLYRDAAQYTIVVASLFMPFLAALRYQQDAALQTSLLFAISGACLVLNNIWRGILLTVDDGMPFHLITVIPAASLTLAVIIIIGILPDFETRAMAWAFVLAGVMSLVLSFLVFPLRKVNGFTGVKPNYPKLITNGADVFVQAMAISIQTYFFLAFLGKTQGDTEVGYFSLSLMAFQTCLLPLQVVSPMVLNLWSKRTGEEALISGRLYQRLLIVGSAGLATLVVCLGPWMIRLILGESFEPAIPAVQISILALIPGLIIRIASLRLAAAGFFRLNSVVAIIRLGAAWLFLLTGDGWGGASMSGSATAAVAWLMAELVGAILSEVFVRHQRRAGSL